MRRQSLIILLIPTAILIIAAALIIAAQTGTISGQITDSQTAQPIVGATVQIVGTNRGAQTDIDGKFTILRVEPGVYDVRISVIGYRELEIKNLQVLSDLTVSIKTSMYQSTEELKDKISVSAEVKVIDKFEASNQSIITKEQIEQNHGKSVDELIEKVAGIVSDSAGAIHIRGGRAFEVSYIVDGAPNNATAGLGGAGSCLTQVPIEKEKAPVSQNDCPPPPYCPPHHGGQKYDDMFFQNYGTNPLIDTRQDYQSTFAMDIDDASYTLCRSYLDRSTLPPADAIRVEEFINHFNYGYNAPRNETFAVYVEGARSRFGQNSQLLRIGIKGKNIDVESSKPSNIVFVVDGSGSMTEGGRFELVQATLKHIINRAGINDRIGIVIYNETAETVIEPTSARHKDKLLGSLDRLYAYGPTNVQAGLKLGFRMADGVFEPSKNNCLLLFSDGVANVGTVDAERLLEETKRYSKKGITLSTVGVGMGNYNDILLEKLGNKGNGFYAYADSFDEARRIFDGNLAGALQVIARDVKIQVEFNPEIVQSYRLLGYENRAVADYNFRNDKVDGGEITPGQSSTALYEINLKQGAGRWSENFDYSGNLGRVFVRYKNPQSGNVEEIGREIEPNVLFSRHTYCTPDFKLAMAVAEFAEIMRDSNWAKNSSLERVRQLAEEVYHQTRDDDVLEFVNLITRARDLRNIESDYFSKD